MARILSKRGRPDLDAAERGGDWSMRMDGEVLPGEATMKQALYWREIYAEIYAMEEKVVARVVQLMEKQSDPARREVELTNVPVVVAQAERFRQRLGYWDARVQDLRGASRPKTIAPRGFIGIRASSRTLSVGRTPDKRLGEAI